jgi:phenylacetate-CoA ligase
MTTATLQPTTWEPLRRELQNSVLAALPEHVQRVGWSRERIHAAQRSGLTRLLAHAAEHSPFHRRRLAGIDLAAVGPEDLSALPTMTKTDMMGALDDVFTDPRLNRGVVEQALAATGDEPVPILGAYMSFVTGGTSGERGIFVFDVAARSAFALSVMRTLAARLQAAGGPPPGGLPVAMVGAASAVHATGAAAAETAGGELPLRVTRVSVTLLLSAIVERLNALQAPALFGYPSMLMRLANERRAGRLHLSPSIISSTGETLTPQARDTIGEAFQAPIVDTYATSEGLAGTSAPGDPVLVFNSDLCIVELVDDADRPVAPGVASSKVLLTNLTNLAQPLIRYELADAFVRQPAAAEHGHLRARVQGRSGGMMRYGDVDIHAHVVRSVIASTQAIIDYRVLQTPRGVDVEAIAPSGDLHGLSDRLAAALAGAGLARPQVRVRIVDELARDRQTGKLQRFVALPSSAGPPP